MADVYVNALTQISTEPTSTDSVVCVNRNTNEGQIIDYELLASKILDKLTSKTYSSLTTTSKLLTGAINELDGDVSALNTAVDGFLPSQRLTASNVATVTINIPSAARGYILVVGNGSGYRGIMSYYCSSSGTVSIYDIAGVNNFTHTTSTNSVTFTADSGTPVWNFGVIRLNGSALSITT